jgi:uncharacterized paraquat-inducible protein A
MSTQDPTRSARRPRTRPNTLVLHYCNACDATWQNERRQFRCPRCKYVAPRGADKNFQVIAASHVNTNEDGRIICHLPKTEE